MNTDCNQFIQAWNISKEKFLHTTPPNITPEPTAEMLHKRRLWLDDMYRTVREQLGMLPDDERAILSDR